MSKDKKSILIKNIAFPDQLATDAEKATVDFGLRVGKAIEGEWFSETGRSCRFYSQKNSFNKLRLYSMGKQPIDKYKSEMAVDGDLSKLNIDWAQVPVIPKFVDIVVNGMQDRLFSIKTYARDIVSANKRNDFQEAVEADMVAKDFLHQTQQEFGVNAFTIDPETLPESDEELSLFMQINYKPGQEIASEVAIDTVFDNNRYNDITRPRIAKDIVDLGIGVAKHQFYKNGGVSLEYVDPENLVYSYTDDPYFRDVFYWGEVKRVHISEIYKINPDIKDEEVEAIRRTGDAWNVHFQQSGVNGAFDKDIITLLYFNYKTDKKFVFKKKILENGGERVIRRDESFLPPEDSSMPFERVDVVREVWYDGIMVLGSEIMLKWELMRNMVRPKSATQHALPNYVACAPRMYKGRIDSLVNRMIPFADAIQMTHLKIQQVASKVVPDGVFIDADGINEVDLGTGGAYTPEDALRLYFQTGSVIGRSSTGDGEFNNARIPIQELNTNSGQSKLTSLINNYNYYLNMIRDVTGINEVRDGSTPNPDALVGVQKLAALSSNTATRHILDASLYIMKSIAEGVSMRISDILEYSDFAEEFAMQIGKYNMAVLEDIKELHLYDFGIFIEVSPDEEEKQMLESNIQVALQRDQIDLEDAIDIRQMKNIKLANEMLKLKRRKKQKKQEEREDMQQAMQAQLNQQAQQMAAQAKMEQIQAEINLKGQLKQIEIQGEIEKMKAEAELKKELMNLEFEMNMQLKGVEVDNLMKRESKKEEAKDKRVDKQAAAQSKLIEQRQKGLPPVSFESNEDSLDGFDLDSFSPR